MRQDHQSAPREQAATRPPARREPEGPAADPRRLSSADLATLQRAAGNSAVTRMLAVQRAGEEDQGGTSSAQGPPHAQLKDFLDDWLEKSAVKWSGRSTELKAIDRAVQTWLDGGYQTLGNLDLNHTQLTAVRGAIDAWQSSKTGPSKRGGFVDQLSAKVDAAITEIGARRAQRQEQQRLVGKFNEIDPRMAGHARRGPKDVDPENNQMHAALVADREQGRLPDRSLAVLNQIAQSELHARLAIVGGVTPQNATREQIRKIMSNNTNSISGSTIYPDLGTYLAGMGETGELTAEHSSGASGATDVAHRTVGSTRLTVHSDPSDPKRAERLAQLEQAITKVQAAGYQVPALSAYFPKYGRGLVVSEGGVTTQPGKLNRAEYIPPDAVVASPEIMDNPLDNRMADGRPTYLSTEVDPSGVGTMVHELGHFLHYHQNQRRFHDLVGTQFAGSTGGRHHGNAALSVSAYAAQNPREFIAEVFLGRVYGRDYPEDVMEMYHAFGGPEPSEAGHEANA